MEGLLIMMSGWFNNNNAQNFRNFCGSNGNNGFTANNGYTNFFNGGMIIMMIAIFALLIGAAYLIWKQTQSNTSGHQSLSALTEQELRDELDHRKSSKDLDQELADLKREIKALKEK